MQSIIEYLFGAASFVPHGYCLLWRPDLVAMHAISDFLIAASYFSIPIAISAFVTQRSDIQYPWVFWHFAAFIAACGATHVAGLLTLWWPAYGAQGLIKLATATVSVATAVMLWPLLPKALALPSPEQLRLSNEDLRRALGEKEQALFELQSLLDSAPLAMLLIDARGVITRISAGAAATFGYAAEALVGRRVELLVPAWERDTRHADGASTGPHRVETEGCTSDGRVFPLELVIGQYQLQDGLRACVAVRDISRERQAEAARQQAEQALRQSESRLAQAQKMEAVGQLSGGVAHDFNNLLTVIAGNLQLHAARLPPHVDQQLLDDAREAVEMGARLTERLLTFSRQRELAPVTIDLNRQVPAMAELLRRSLGETIAITTVLGPDLWPIRADPGGIENVIVNLAINARDAMPRGGKLTIETRNVTLDHGKHQRLEPGDYVLLSVCDSGCGMPPDVVARAFEPFFTTKEPGKGTGLGLSIVYGFIRQSGGHAEIYSEPGIGTTVNVYLPRSAAEPEPDRKAEPPLSIDSAIGRTVLVVEDNPLVRRLTVRRIEELGIAVREADSGPAAVALIESGEPFDLVFSDVIMAGGMSGLELARWIQERRPSLRIVLTSGFAEEIASGEGIKAPRVLRKPYSQAQLMRMLGEAMNAPR